MTRSIGESQDATHRERGTIPEDTFASRLMLARVHAGYQTIDEASAKCGLNRQSWSNWEKGMKPRDLLDVVNAISEGLGVDRDWLLFGGPLAQPEPAGRRQLKRRNRDTAEYGLETARTSARHTAATIPGPFAQVGARPGGGDHRPSRRLDSAGTAPGLVRPTVRPRRTSV